MIAAEEEENTESVNNHHISVEEEESDAHKIEKLEAEVARLSRELENSKERLCDEILDLRKQKQKLQKEIHRLNVIIKETRDAIEQPKSLQSGLENAVNYVVGKYFKRSTPKKLVKPLLKWHGVYRKELHNLKF